MEADQSTGRIIHVLNGQVLNFPKQAICRAFQCLWNELSIVISFESDWKRAKDLRDGIVREQAGILSEAAQKRLIEATKNYMTFYNTLTPFVYTSIKENGVSLTIRYLANPRRRRVTEHKIWEDILHMVGENKDINFAYPTNRILPHQEIQ